MVGALGRGAGKTKLACSLIRKFSSRHNIIGIKVTPVEKADGSCPRGGSGCGVCSSLDGHYYIAEETDHEADKDTCRMLASGAERVFWLRALKTHLEEGAAALLDVIGSGVVSVCESNSLRRVIEPGLFIMVKGCGEENRKASAKDVIQYADRTVFFDGNEFDIDVDEIELADGRWACKMDATVIIMAGGNSVRMGQDKDMLPIDGQPIIKYIVDRLRPHFNQILISSNDVSKYSFPDVEVVPDKIAGQGPLMGIASALEASVNEVNFVIACDIPQIDISFIKMMLRQVRSGYDAVVPRTGPSQYEPLFAVYRKGILDTANELLSSGKRRIAEMFSRCRVRYIDLSDTEQIKNLNTMNDYLEFLRRQNGAAV